MKVRDHSELFQQQDYQEQFDRKKEFENLRIQVENMEKRLSLLEAKQFS